LFSVAELWRVKGELLLKYEDSHAECRVKAGECFGKSLEVARSQQLKSWELRTMMSLHRHGFAEVDTDADLSVCYGWFSEGFATADLAECRAMLEAQPNC
jgi:predicted ATPase